MTGRRRGAFAAFGIAAASALTLATACASFSGYDASRYAEGHDASDYPDPDTVALARARRTLMLDPRSPIADGGADAADARARAD